MSKTTRPIARGDRADWDRLWRGYLAFYDTTLPLDRFDLQFDRLTDPGRDDVTGFVAEDAAGRLVGLAHCIWHAHGWHAQPVCYLQDLFTAPAARGQGVGAALIGAVYAHADSRAAAGVYWTTQHFNHAARALYDRIGRLTPFIKYERPA